MPVLNGKFCYDKLIDNLRAVLHSHNMTLPANSYILYLTTVLSAGGLMVDPTIGECSM